MLEMNCSSMITINISVCLYNSPVVPYKIVMFLQMTCRQITLSIIREEQIEKKSS